MYRRALSTLGCSEFSLDEALALASGHQIAALELRALSGSIDLPAAMAADHGSPAATAERVARTGVEIAVLDTSLRLMNSLPSEREQLLAYVPWAEALGVRWLRVFDGGARLDATELACAAETLTWWREQRGRLGCRVDLAVETHDSLLDAARIRKFIAAMPAGAIHLVWDAHHTWRRGSEDPLVTWHAVREHVAHVHVKDSIGAPSVRHPFTYVLPGSGQFPMERLRPALAAEFNGAVSLEWERLWHPYLPPIADALRIAAERSWW